MHHRQVLCALILWTVCVSSWNTVTASGRDNPTYACESYNRQNRTQNRCEGINDIIVEQRVQESTNKKLWCIVLNNENNVYNGQNLIINFTARGFGVATLFAERLSMTPSSAVFKLNAGVNTIALYGLNKKSPFPRIKSLKLEGDELCSNDGRGRSFNEDIPDQLALDSELYPKHDNFRFVNHCRDKSETLTTTKWCPGVEIPATSFIVEKFKLHDEDYWCMNFETETNDPSQKKLDFLLSNGDKELAWVCIIKFTFIVISFEMQSIFMNVHYQLMFHLIYKFIKIKLNQEDYHYKKKNGFKTEIIHEIYAYNFIIYIFEQIRQNVKSFIHR